MGYSTDLTDAQWELIKPVFESNKGKNFVKHSKRGLISAVLYLIKTDFRWRLLSKDFPPYTAVWPFYRRATESGNREEAMVLLVKTREKANRKKIRLTQSLTSKV